MTKSDEGLKLADRSRVLDEGRTHAGPVGRDRGLACGQRRRAHRSIRAGHAAKHFCRAA